MFALEKGRQTYGCRGHLWQQQTLRLEYLQRGDTYVALDLDRERVRGRQAFYLMTLSIAQLYSVSSR